MQQFDILNSLLDIRYYFSDNSHAADYNHNDYSAENIDSLEQPLLYGGAVLSEIILINRFRKGECCG